MNSVVPPSLNYPVKSRPSKLYATNAAGQDHSEP